ncbi:MAG: 2OG-Fe(II) oxygenase [Hyphomicrobiales bacterium]|nr:2OG-Fe(II) oxygenase [Hyphomicrobiales bacterium]
MGAVPLSVPNDGVAAPSDGLFHRQFPGLFSPEECASVIALAEASGLADGGLVRGQTDHTIRRAEIAWLDDAGNADWVMERIVDTRAAANREKFGFVLDEFGERLQVVRYRADQAGTYDWHSDIGAGSLAAKRKLTIVVQLSDTSDYDGGNLELNPAGLVLTASRSRGNAIVFPSFVLHRVAPVTAGTRYSLTLWVHGPAFR